MFVGSRIGDFWWHIFYFQILLIFVFVFFDTIFSIFSIFTSYFRPYLVTIPVVSTWIVYYISNIGLIMYAGQNVKNVGAETTNLIHKVINSEANRDLIEKFSKLSQQLVHRTPQFYGGCITFDLVLFQSVSSWNFPDFLMILCFFQIVSTTILYVTILIQFEVSSESFRQMMNQTQICNQSSA